MMEVKNLVLLSLSIANWDEPDNDNKQWHVSVFQQKTVCGLSTTLSLTLDRIQYRIQISYGTCLGNKSAPELFPLLENLGWVEGEPLHPAGQLQQLSLRVQDVPHTCQQIICN